MPDARRAGMWAVITVLVAFGPLSTDMYLPALPAIGADLDATVAETQLTLSAFLIGFALAQLVYGPLSDRFGRRPVILGGVAIYLVASAACALADTIEALIAARFAQALGACAGPVLGRAVVRDLFGREGAAKALAYIGTAMGLIPAVAPILGGLVTEWLGWRANFAILVGIGVLLVLGVTALLHETNRHRDPGALDPAQLGRNYLSLLRSREYAGYVLAVASSYAALFCFLSGSPFVLIEYFGVAPTVFGYYFAAVVVGYMAGTVLTARLTGRLGVERMLRSGAVLGVFGAGTMEALSLAGVDHVWAVVGPMVVVMASVGIVLPSGMAGAVGPFPRMAGVASAGLGFVQMMGGALAGAAVGAFHDGTPASMIGTMLAVTLIGLAVFAWLVGARPSASKAEESAVH